ncbi:MAG: hypothetical protein IJW40_10880 [Clostridia bacterium]|nr:hypothetical protein [Clostridia bacterium]
MAIKMRILCTAGKKKLVNIANMIKAEYDLSINSVDKIPPAYSCDKERVVILALSGKGDVPDDLRLFCRELTKARASNVALLVDGNAAYAESVKTILKEAGTNVIDEVLYIKAGLPFLSGIKPEEKTLILDWVKKVTESLQ